MSQSLTSTNQSLTFRPQVADVQESKPDYANTAYTIFAFIISLLLIGLGLRIALALFVVTGPFSSGLTILTDPIVMPSTHIFKDIHGMIQTATALSFSAIYGIYWIVALLYKLFRVKYPYIQTSREKYNDTYPKQAVSH
jgi:uncharacterized membrane protein